jgi:hypothetical protein
MMSEELLERVDFVALFLPMLNSDQLALIVEVVDVLEATLVMLGDRNPGLGTELIGRMQEDGLADLLEVLLANSSPTLHATVLHFEETMRSFSPLE